MEIKKNHKNKKSILFDKSKNNIVLYKDYFEESDDEKTIRANFKDFLLSSSLHGLKYTANEQLSIFERIFFVISFIFVVILSGYFINNVYVKWSDSPIILSTNPTPTYTSTMPFPAITICGLNKARMSKVKKIMPGTINAALLSSLCSQDIDLNTFKLPTYLGTWALFRDILIEVSQPCEKMILYCIFGDKVEDCDQIFNPILTDDGLCCTFNAVDPNLMFKNYTDDYLEKKEPNNYIPVDWTPEKGYDTILPDYFYPRIALGIGKSMGLTIILNASKDEYYCSSARGVGFKALIHNPAELPKISNFGFFIDAGKESRVSITPTFGTASKDIRSIDTKIRHCLFSDEGNLTYFRWYSRKNCELECEARILVEVCGCVLYYLPRLSSNIPICGPKDNNCTKKTQITIAKANTNLTCENCYPACFELSYTHELSAIGINNNNNNSKDSYPSKHFNGSADDIAIIHIYYASGFFRSIIKNEIIGFTEFLSNTGGLLGLFMGFSIFSLIEILYFMSLKPFCLYKKRQNENKGQYLDKQNMFKSTKNFTFGTSSWGSKNINKKEHLNQLKYPKLQVKQKSSNIFKKLSNASHEKVFPYCE